MERSYEYAVGAVRARERKLLRRADLETLLSAGTVEELVRLLQDKGYGEAGGTATVDALLSAQTQATWDYVASIAPDMSVFDCFLCQNDAHNVKLTVKGILRDIPYEHLLLSPGTLELRELRQAVADRRFDKLPEWIAAAAGTAYELVAGAEDAQLGDAVIDRAAMQQMLTAAKAVRSAWLTQHITLTVFYHNVKIALRAARIGRSADFIEQALCPCDELDLKTLKQAALAGEAELVERLSHRDVLGLPAAMEAYKVSPSAFEKWVDDRLMAEALTCKRVTVGPEPLIGYVLARQTESKVIRIIASGIRTGQAEETIRERVRELYG